MSLSLLKAPETRPLLKRLWRIYVMPSKRYLLGGILCMALSALSTAVLAKCLQPIFDDIFTNHDHQKLFTIAFLVLGVFVLKGLSTYGEVLTMSFVGQKIIADCQAHLFSHVIESDLNFFHEQSSGVLVSTFTYDVQLLRGSITQTLTSMGKDTLTFLFLVALMFYQDWFLAFLAFFVFPIAIIPLVRVGARMRKISTGTQEVMGDFHGFLQQIFQGIRLVKAYGMEAYEKKRATDKIKQLFKIHLKGVRIRSAAHPIMETLGGIAIVVVILYGGIQVISGNRTTGAFISFITALLLAYEPVKRLVHLNATLQEGLAAAGRLFQILDTPPQIENSSNAVPLKIEGGEIVFDRISFNYPSGKKVFQDLSFSISKGQQVALVGPSGSGKSTLFNLLLRFYDLQEGCIRIDGQRLQDVTLASLRQQIAFVSQEITLFDDTVYNNILYGRPGASFNEVEKAAQDSAAHKFILELPKGYQTMVGEGGIKLSGGQRQRLAIARAMLKDAPILLLDEATSSLDTQSEHAVQKALQHLMKGRTTLMIAHRLSTVENVDCIFVFEQGQLKEADSHKNLMKRKGLYAQLVLPQLLQGENSVLQG